MAMAGIGPVLATGLEIYSSHFCVRCEESRRGRYSQLPKCHVWQTCFMHGAYLTQ